MTKASVRIALSIVLLILFSSGLAAGAFAQESPSFVPGNLVVSVEGCGVSGGTCTAVPNGTGNGTGNSSTGGYGDNQAAPLTLFQYLPNGTASATFVNSLVFPQIASGANLSVSGEYGSSSEGTVQLSGTGQYLAIVGYGINANTFNANPNSFSATPNSALAQSGSLTGQGYTPVSRVVTLVDPYGNINSSTALFNVFDTNNPRSAYTADGVSSVYVSGQGSGCDATGGVFLSPLGAVNNAPVAITGLDAGSNSSCPTTLAQDTRDVQIVGNTLYISADSREGSGSNRSFIGTLGTPPATSLYTEDSTVTPGGPTMLTGFGNTGGTGKETITSGTHSNGNGPNAGLQINLSPEDYFFASPSVLYVADSGSPKQTSANSPLGDGGLQKWINSQSNGSGTWSLAYTLSAGLNLVPNTSAAGTTGLQGLTGKVSGGTVALYATNFTIGDLDPSFLFGITDTLSATTNPGTTFTQLAAAPQDSNFKGVAFAPTLPAGSATITSTPSGLAFTSSGTGCAPGTYTTPVTLIWTPGSSCQLSVASLQGSAGSQFFFTQWQDGTTATTDTVTAPATAAVYTATFSPQGTPSVTFPTGSAINYGQPLSSSILTGGKSSIPGTFAFTTPGVVPTAGTTAKNVTFTPSNSPEFASVTGTVLVTVNKATLTVTANNLSKAVGATNPALSASFSGFVNGDASAVVSGAPSLSTTATASSPAGDYPITASVGTLTAANYKFTFVNGTLSVVEAPTVVLTTTATLSGSASAGYTATVTVTNSGTGAASKVILSAATLGAASGSPVPENLGSLAANGGSATVVVRFPASAGADGAHVVAEFSGTYTDGTFVGGIRATLP
jgi:hypothetical protein